MFSKPLRFILLFALAVPALYAASQADATGKNNGSDTVTGSKLLNAAEAAKLLPAGVFFRGQSAPVQGRNSGGVRFTKDALFLVSLVDTAGYSTSVQEKYQAYLITESPINIEGHRLLPGAYGCGFLTGNTFVVMDIGGHELFSVHSTRDAGLRRPTPLQVLPSPGGSGYRLYVGRDYVKLYAGCVTSRIGTAPIGYSFPGTIPRPRTDLRSICFAAACALFLMTSSGPAVQGQALHSASPDANIHPVSPIVSDASVPNLPSLESSPGSVRPAGSPSTRIGSPVTSPQLIVIGFMGGRVKGGNLVHREALLAKELQERYPLRVYAAVYANHDAKSALKIVLHLLDENRDGRLSEQEKSAARIVIYGHSWGASETIALARRLNTLGIPVLLTIQVDSVEKPYENDEDIPPNVHEAINFYQTEGLLHGRSLIEAMDPEQTTILGNYESSYKSRPVSCSNYPWFARTFMKPHIEIENDPSVWGKIATLIRTKLR